MVKKQLDKEDKVISKINNKYELAGYIFKYRTKELLAVLALVLAGLLVWFYMSGVSPVDIKNWQKKTEVKEK